MIKHKASLAAKRNHGFTLLLVAFAVFLISLGLMVAAPVWQTVIQRELEEELIFRGNQYVEAVRLFQLKNPGQFPSDFESMLEESCLRRPFADPMTEHGQWNVILQYGNPSSPQPGTTQQRGTSTERAAQAGGSSSQTILVAPFSALEAIPNPRIIGVVSSSTQQSKMIYNDQTSYDQWLFFLGYDPENPPQIMYYGEEKK